MPAWINTIMDSLVSAGIAVLSWILGMTSTGVIALSEPPLPPVIPDAPDTMAQEITVMSFNVWVDTGSIGQRMNGVLETIRAAAPDSFGLQEAHELWRLPLWWALRGEYGIACWQGRYWGLQEATPIFYNKSKYKLVDQGVFWLSDIPGKTSMGWDAALPRVAGYAVLKDKQTGFTYVHFNAHFDHRGPIARTNSARLIADKINELNLPAVFTADINAGPASQPVQYLELGGLQDLRSVAGETDTGRTFHAYGSGGSVIDYVFANHYLREPGTTAKFWVIRDEYDGMYPSDHFAVAATLTLAN